MSDGEGLNILHVIGSVAPRDGGPTVAIKGMSAALARLGCRVTVATTNADGPHGVLDVPLTRPAVVDGVSYRYFPRTLPGTFGLSLSLSRWLRRNISDFDVVEIHGLFVFATRAGCRSAARAGIPYVVRPLGMLDPWSLSQHSWKKAPYIRFVERPQLAGAAAIHATSESEADGVRALGFGDRVHVIPLGVAAVTHERRADSTDADVELLFLSRLHPKKNIPLLLDALRRVRSEGGQLKLTIAGSGTDAYRAELERQVLGLGLEKVVRFTGHVDGDAKDALFANADVFVLLSNQENFGIAVAEALAAGLPVVVSDQVAIAPDVLAAGAGLVVPVEAVAAAKALTMLASSRERRLDMGRRAAQLARDRYSWDRTAHSLRSLFSDLVAVRGNRKVSGEARHARA